MKLSGSVVSVIVSGVVLMGALGVGLGIREVRVRKAKAEAQALAKLQKAPARKGPLSRSATGVDRQTAEAQDRQRTGQDREQARAKWESASPEEREKMAQQMGDRFRSRGPGGGRFGANLSPEERAKMEAEMQNMRQRFESMSEEERAQAREQMRQRFESRRGGGSGGPGQGDRTESAPVASSDANQTSATEGVAEK